MIVTASNDVVNESTESPHQEEEKSGEFNDEDRSPSNVDLSPLEMDRMEESPPNNKTYLGVAQLTMVIWYNVSGGAFGVEESVRSAGFFASILGFAIMPLVWSLPEALVTAELGCAYPEAAGGVAWVEEAFGSAAGWQAGWLGWVAGATDNAIYPVLFLDYASQFGFSSSTQDLSASLRFLLHSLTTALLGYLNWRGLHIVGNMSIVIGALSMAPFVAMVLIGIFKVDPSRWLQIPEQDTHARPDSNSGAFGLLFNSAILWRPLFNCLFWNLNSYDSTASYAAEVRDAGFVLPRSLMWGFALMMVGYLLPLMVAIGATDSEPVDWIDGYLTTAAEEIGGKWLGGWVVFAAGVSNIALFEAELSADAFQLMGMAERGFVPKIFAARSRHGTPTFGILLGAAVIIAMGSFDLEELIEMLNFNYAISLLMEYAAFVKLRICKPDVPRPFRIPLGTPGSIAFLSFPLLGILLIMSLASAATILFSVGINFVGFFIYYLYRGSPCSRVCGSYAKLPSQFPSESIEQTGDDVISDGGTCMAVGLSYTRAVSSRP